MDAKIIGLAGTQGSGKDYMYKYLVGALPGQLVKRIAFADGVREEVAMEVLAALGIQGIDVDPTTWDKPYTDGQRWILQQWGTEFRRAQNPDYWVLYGMKKAAEMKADLVVFTDVRFANEADAIRTHGGKVVQVTASEEVRAFRNGVSLESLRAAASHDSEVIDFSCDYVVLNNTTPELEPGLRRWLGL